MVPLLCRYLGRTLGSRHQDEGDISGSVGAMSVKVWVVNTFRLGYGSNTWEGKWGRKKIARE